MSQTMPTESTPKTVPIHKPASPNGPTKPTVAYPTVTGKAQPTTP